MMMRMECERCQGSGQIIGTPCSPCSGKGFENSKVQEEIRFPRGIDSGATLKFKGKVTWAETSLFKFQSRVTPFSKDRGMTQLGSRKFQSWRQCLGLS